MLCDKYNCPIIYLILLLLFAGCNVDKTPLKTDTGIDPEIIGDWNYKTTGTIAGDVSVEAVHGICILEDGVVLPLAVEISTGKLSELPEPSPGTFLFAQNGRFKFQANQLGMLLASTYKSTYQVNSQELRFETMTEIGSIVMLNEKYTKSKLGDVVTNPIQTHLGMMMENALYENARISAIPSAYAGYSENDSTFRIHAVSQYHYVISIYLKKFHGAGTYQLGSETFGIAALYSNIGDDIPVISTDMHHHAGNIAIESFDLVNKRCNGTFEFEIDSVQYSNGIFNVPIYEAD